MEFRVNVANCTGFCTAIKRKVLVFLGNRVVIRIPPGVLKKATVAWKAAGWVGPVQFLPTPFGF
jgi:hypothetical protein